MRQTNRPDERLNTMGGVRLITAKEGELTEKKTLS